MKKKFSYRFLHYNCNRFFAIIYNQQLFFLTKVNKPEHIVQTPLMKQYSAIKAKHPDAILLFRVGDFYETFSVDAIKTAEILGITLTKRANGSASFVELAGFPYHALDTYLPKLVRAGQRVAICEQLEDPKMTKNIVKRGITELVTPGITTERNVLDHKENNYLASINLGKMNAGVAFLDISTGELYVAEGNYEYVDKLINNFLPKEILVERSKQSLFFEIFGKKFYTYPLDDWMFNPETSQERLLKQFDTVSLKGFGVQKLQFATTAAGAALHYLDLTHHHQTEHISKIMRIEEDKYVWLDKFTVRNLELFQSPHENAVPLISILDKTASPMGARMLKRWLALPLKDLNEINKRLLVVETFVQNKDLTEVLETYLKQMGDMERIISRVALNKILPREIIQLKNALTALKPLKELCLNAENQHLQTLAEGLDSCQNLKEKIERELREDTTNQLQKGNVIAKDVSPELDELRELAFSGKDYLANLQKKQAELTGISSLKISFNNVFGYYFEVRNIHKDRVPSEWIRKQTLVGAERYINEELKEYESKILGAEEKILAIEMEIYNQLVAEISKYISIIQNNAHHIAQIDCLRSFAEIAEKNHYVKPQMNDSFDLDIKEGRHPVIETLLPQGEEYIPNDVKLNQKDQQIIIITGPNMAGKSALLRQTALIVLMAQMGSFVPAKSASMGFVDKIFTRVGATDNISAGESTFMVEMNEAASILNNISHRSLVLFDELGRGTSTYDGISIAWAIVEYLHEHPLAKAKTLFATHYHELNEMANSLKRVKNYNVSVKEVGNKVLFMRKLVKGGSEHSFGIHVAKMAGMPKSIVQRADQILEELEKSREGSQINKPVNSIADKREGFQLSFFQLDDPVLKQIRDEIAKIDINSLTPLDALNKLSEIKKLAGVK